MAHPGPRSRDLAARMAAVESPAFDARRAAREAASGEDQTPIVYARGEGSFVFDADGERYVDLTAGFGALLLGHAPNAASQAAIRALNELVLALGDVYASELKVRACEAIAALHPRAGARVMLGLSGADAITCALKTALLATGKPGVVAFHGSYHGLSYGPLAALGFAPSFREPFAAHLGVPVTFAPYPSSASASSDAELDASLSAVRAASDIGAILVEPLLGRGGCVVPLAGFLASLRAIATEKGALLIADEIWTGLGRSGAMLASADADPDVICLGKGLGGGLPISACVGTAEAMEAWGGHGGGRIHTGTHFGSPPACAAALATLEEIRRRDLVVRARENGAQWAALLQSVAGDRVVGRGLMLGVRLADASTALTASRRLLARGFIVLTGGARGDTLTLTPALNIAPGLLIDFARELEDLRLV